MFSNVFFIIIATFGLFAGQNLLIAPGTSINEPIIACVLALIISPWLRRQFD